MTGEDAKKFEDSGELKGNAWILKSEKPEANRAADEVERRLRELGWAEEDIVNFKIAITEAVANAILHGNEERPDKKVTVNVRADRDSVTVRVKDEGTGFKLKNVPSPTEGEGLVKSSGRGVFLMQQFSDDFRVEGNEVTLVKRKTRPAS